MTKEISLIKPSKQDLKTRTPDKLQEFLSSDKNLPDNRKKLSKNYSIPLTVDTKSKNLEENKTDKDKRIEVLGNKKVTFTGNKHSKLSKSDNSSIISSSKSSPSHDLSIESFEDPGLQSPNSELNNKLIRDDTFRCSSPTKIKLNPDKRNLMKSISTKMIDPNQKQNVRLAQHVMDTMNMQMIEMQYFMKDILKYSTDNQEEESNDGKIEAADKIAVKLLFNEDITDFFEAQEIMQKGYVNLVKQFTEDVNENPSKNSQKILEMIKATKEFFKKCIFCKKQMKKKRTG